MVNFKNKLSIIAASLALSMTSQLVNAEIIEQGYAVYDP